MWFVSSLYLQQVLGLSPLHTGLTFLPMTLAILLVASRAGALVSRFGVRAVLGSGLVMMTVGLVLLARIADSGSGIVYIMIPGVLTAAGIAMSIVPSTIAATQGSKPGQQGLASGLVNTSRQVGGGLGLAVLITLATQRSSHQIGHGVQVPQALTDGFRLAYLIGAGLAGAALLLTILTVQRADPERRAAARRLAGGDRGRRRAVRRPRRRLRQLEGRPDRRLRPERRRQLRIGARAAPAADHDRREDPRQRRSPPATSSRRTSTTSTTRRSAARAVR